MDRIRAQVSLYVCMGFENFSRLVAPTEPKVVPYGRVLDNTLLRHVFSAAVFSARALLVIVVPIGLTLWSVQLPLQLHVILAEILT